jgi:hypothetical protein
MELNEGDIIRYVGGGGHGPEPGNLGFIEELPNEGWVAICIVRKDGSLAGCGSCPVECVEPAKDDGRVAAYHHKKSEDEARYLQWGERYSALLRRIESRHGLQKDQARVIYNEVDAARSYLREPPEGLWKPEEEE